MRKISSYLAIIIGLLLVAIGIAVVVRLVNRSNSATTRQAETNFSRLSALHVLQAHSGRSDRDWTRFTQKGTLRYYTNFSTGSQSRFERKLTLSTDGPVVRYDRATLNIDQSYLFDGKTLVRTTSESGTQLEVKAVDGMEADSIKFQLATFGLLPILKRLSDPGTQVVYVGNTSKGNQFEVKTVNGPWYFYSNSKHLIDRLQIGEINITFDDYRLVEGLTLPFYQNVSKGDAFLYEIHFNAIGP